MPIFVEIDFGFRDKLSGGMLRFQRLLRWHTNDMEGKREENTMAQLVNEKQNKISTQNQKYPHKKRSINLNDGFNTHFTHWLHPIIWYIELWLLSELLLLVLVLLLLLQHELSVFIY